MAFFQLKLCLDDGSQSCTQEVLFCKRYTVSLSELVVEDGKCNCQFVFLCVFECFRQTLLYLFLRYCMAKTIEPVLKLQFQQGIGNLKKFVTVLLDCSVINDEVLRNQKFETFQYRNAKYVYVNFSAAPNGNALHQLSLQAEEKMTFLLPAMPSQEKMVQIKVDLILILSLRETFLMYNWIMVYVFRN